MTDEPDEASGDADRPGARGAEGPDASRDRSGLVAGEAAAIARFGEGPALFSADVPAPRHPHVGPLLPHRRIATWPTEAFPAMSAAPSTELVRARRDLPARRVDTVLSTWARAGSAARRGVEVVVDWTARGVVAAVDAVGTAAQAVVTLVFGPERAGARR
ncbi:hypothetical protein LQ327_08320 [Actinomycetospora endophytica]|uniref:Uncharacterized protein n=1 Tax=Actinomycetospora endophytica TaxID=2291215 RepID=A0ABS8P8M7_9PSEU|nr:hypothetical protein [Actinomycetospora endophytica]MCD2193389.1 hypothetical protein [Actinomycetospora endophytica]